MTDLMQFTPEDTKTVTAIYSHYKKVGDSEQRRGYIGASVIGHHCERALWYGFRFCCKSNFDGRMYRLFSTGDREESRFIADLRAIGCVVHETGEDCKQFAVSDLGGHFSGHMDGCGINIPEAPQTWHVLEFKTHNAKSFAKLKKEGVKKAKPQHYAQMQVYMHLTGMTRALYLAVNKDTDELYSERIHYNKEESCALIDRAERIIKTTTPPERISSRQDYYECSYCDAKEICWGCGKSALPIPAISCRQCCHATPTMDGHACWTCDKHKRNLSIVDQAKACKDHLVLPCLISFSEPTNYGKRDDGSEYIEFGNREKDDFWIHGTSSNDFNTKELILISPKELTNPLIKKAKEVMGAVVSDVSEDILFRYPESDSRIKWKGPVSGIFNAWKSLYGEELQSLNPVNKYDGFDYKAAEFTGDRLVVMRTDISESGLNNAEIREGIK